MTKIKIIPLDDSCHTFLMDIDPIFMSIQFHFFYYFNLKLIWIVVNPLSPVYVLCLLSLDLLELHWEYLNRLSSTGPNGNTASTSSTMTHCFGSLPKAFATTFLGPLRYWISGPYSLIIISISLPFEESLILIHELFFMISENLNSLS